MRASLHIFKFCVILFTLERAQTQICLYCFLKGDDFANFFCVNNLYILTESTFHRRKSENAYKRNSRRGRVCEEPLDELVS